jgi:Tfp pilus assembly protein PilF
MYAWCLLQINKKDKAISILQKGLTILPNDKNLNISLTNLQNNKKIKLNVYGDEWYQFRLEKHPQELMAQKQMFKTSKKQRIKRR